MAPSYLEVGASGKPGAVQQDTEWFFQKEQKEPGSAAKYVFTGVGLVPSISNAFLVPAGSVGRDVQLKRRLKAIGALKNHVELLQMLSDPRGQLFDSFEQLADDASLHELDEPKQEALRELTEIIPLYLVQGPPGVGKTRLVRDLVRRRFSEEPSTRMLLSAQSNAAVDHLMNELDVAIKMDGDHSRPLVVRSRSRESSVTGPFEMSEVSSEMVESLAASSLVEGAPNNLKRQVRELVSAIKQSVSQSEKGASLYTVRAFEGLIVRAANIVFATTNSGELERLIDEKAQFDWAIVEEGAKATGGEIVSPLMLSHRRLIIGDHKQLPPFGLKEMKAILEVPESVKRVLVAGEDFIGRSLRDSTTEEILDEVEDDAADLPALCAEAIKIITLFERLIEPEFKRQAAGRGGRSIAKKLTVQHRMHPAIARVISASFYDNELHTAPKREKFFESEEPPFRMASGVIGRKIPLVFIDTPYVQEHLDDSISDRLPRWWNETEVNAVVDVLSLHKASPRKTPSLAVLSPYLQQVKRINAEVDKQWNGRLEHLGEFSMATPKGSGVCATVDSFQGNEADLVVVSLVRNNHHTNAKTALGFLTDPRRMNVLLSRARWRLVIVGSRRFLDAVVKSNEGTDQAEETGFLKRFLEAFDKEAERGAAITVQHEKIAGGIL